MLEYMLPAGTAQKVFGVQSVSLNTGRDHESYDLLGPLVAPHQSLACWCTVLFLELAFKERQESCSERRSLAPSNWDWSLRIADMQSAICLATSTFEILPCRAHLHTTEEVLQQEVSNTSTDPPDRSFA